MDVSDNLKKTEVVSDEIWTIFANDRLGRRVRIKCSPEDTIGDLKALIAAQTGTAKDRIRIRTWYNDIRDVPGITIRDVLINGQSVDLY
jgi:ubiquitin-like protein 5